MKAGGNPEWGPRWLNRVSARQRVIVLTFDTVDEAEAWDAAGCPLSALLLDAVEVVS